MKLYYAPGACSLAVHIALREVGAPFELVRVDLATKRLSDGSDYLGIAPRGYVPLLVLPDGTRHSEAAALLQYVADLDPARRLVGDAGSARRLAVTEWLTFIATELHKTFGWLFRRDTPEATRTAVMAKLDRHFAEFEHRLSIAAEPNGERASTPPARWLAGGFSVADAYAFAVLGWATVLKLPLAAYPTLRGYLARVAARPHVMEALAAEGLMPVARAA